MALTERRKTIRTRKNIKRLHFCPSLLSSGIESASRLRLRALCCPPTIYNACHRQDVATPFMGNWERSMHRRTLCSCVANYFFRGFNIKLVRSPLVVGSCIGPGKRVVDGQLAAREQLDRLPKGRGFCSASR